MAKQITHDDIAPFMGHMTDTEAQQVRYWLSQNAPSSERKYFDGNFFPLRTFKDVLEMCVNRCLTVEIVAKAIDERGMNAVLASSLLDHAYNRSSKQHSKEHSSVRLSAYDFFQDYQKCQLVHNAMQCGRPFYNFLIALGFNSNDIHVYEGYPVGEGIRLAFEKWLHAGNSLNDFVRAVQQCENVILLMKLGLSNSSTIENTSQCVSSVKMTTTQPAQNAILTALAAGKKVVRVADFVENPHSSDSTKLWALLNENDLKPLLNVLKSLNVLQSKEVANEFAEQQRLWQGRHNFDSTHESKNSNPALYFFKMLCQDPTINSMSFEQFATTHLLNDDSLNTFVAEYLSRIDKVKNEVKQQNEQVVSAHTEMYDWLVKNKICKPEDAAKLADNFHIDGFETVDQLKECEKDDLRSMTYLNKGQVLRIHKVLHKK